MIENKEIYIYVGFPKTATTFLQDNYFSKLDDFEYFGKPRMDKSLVQELIRTLNSVETLEYNNSFQDFKHKIVEKLFDKSKKYIISDESFSFGSSFMGNVSRYEMTLRLKELFPNAKIIVTLRNQYDVVKSYYAQVIRTKETVFSRTTFEKWFEQEMTNQKYTSVFSLFSYCLYINSLVEIFGKENVKVLFFEEMKKDLSHFINEIDLFIGNKQKMLIENIANNASLTQRQVLFNSFLSFLNLNDKGKYINRDLKNKILKFIESGSKYKIDMPKNYNSHIYEMFAEENKALSKLLNKNLNLLGYPI